VAEFLSPAWIAELDAALVALEPAVVDPDDTFVIEQRVTLPMGAAHAHHVVVAGGRFRAVAGPAPRADLVLTTDLETAVAIQRGTENAQYALAAGKLRLGGDLDRLRARSEVFARLHDVFAELRDATTYPKDPGAPSDSRPEGHH
jgi:hypothetical protein